jgi:hypothetical protein
MNWTKLIITTITVLISDGILKARKTACIIPTTCTGCEYKWGSSSLHNILHVYVSPFIVMLSNIILWNTFKLVHSIEDRKNIPFPKHFLEYRMTEKVEKPSHSERLASTIFALSQVQCPAPNLHYEPRVEKKYCTFFATHWEVLVSEMSAFL